MTSLFKYILDMKRLPYVLLLIVLTGSFFAFRSTQSTGGPEAGKYEKIMRLVGQMLSQAHFSPQAIDDNFSKKVFSKYLETLDPEKNIFLKSDVAVLSQKYGSRIDDELRGAPVESFIAVSKVFNDRVKTSAQWSSEILSKPFDYNLHETYMMDGKKLQYPDSETERKERWRKKLKYLSLERYVDSLDQRDLNKNKPGYKAKTDVQYEREARTRADTIVRRFFDRYRVKYTEDDLFNMFVDAIANTMDPHTEFFPPADKRYFDEEMSGRFFGIGAMLLQTEAGIKITAINPGSPAARSGVLQVGDIISKVGQGDAPEVDLMGYTVQDAVKLIRGKEGSTVSITVKKADGSIKNVKMQRAKIESDIDTYARSAIIKDSVNHTRIGIIYLPEFYADFEDANGRRSYLDVENEVKKLKNEKVDGIIMDLRNNGGGSLYDVVQMAGLFIGDGPVVQVKDRNNRPTILRDKDESILYTGPLAVLVNEFSASASEIFAAAIQDYGRGIIIGGTSTFGKGTVQRNIGLDAKKGFTFDESDLGTVKLTLQKFYRVSGGSTQLKGVVSDIVMPSQLEILKMREKDYEDALPYDEIARADYKPWQMPVDLRAVKIRGEERLQHDSSFVIIKRNSDWLAKENNSSFPLNIDAYRKERKDMREKMAQIEKVQKLKRKMNVSLLNAEKDKYAADKNKQERLNLWLKQLSEDIYLNQAVKALDDMIGMENIARNAATTTQLATP
jgi:carboxyl-terminal processing protease